MMPAVEVVSHVRGRSNETLLTEDVPSDTLANGHSAEQLVERLGWALIEAEDQEQAADLSRVPGDTRRPAKPFDSFRRVPEQGWA